MRLKNYLLVVGDIEKSKKFYKELFDLETVSSFEGNIVLSSSLVLQEKGVWEEVLGEEVSQGHAFCELYFETEDLDFFLKRLYGYGERVKVFSELRERTWGQRMIRVFDPDHHLIEIAESAHAVIRRLYREKMDMDEIARKTGSPKEEIEAVCGVKEANASEEERDFG